MINKLGDIKDMGRYLQEDCYCPGEIYSPDGFFFKIFNVDDECKVIEENEGKIAVVVRDQAIIFWRDGDVPGKIIAAQRVDATENNIGILRSIVRGEKPDGRKIDEFKPGSTQKALNKVMSIADAVMID